MTKKISEFCRSRKFYHHFTRRTVMFLSWASTVCFTRSRHTHARTHTHTQYILVYKYKCILMLFPFPSVPLVSAFLHAFPYYPPWRSYRGADKSLAWPGRKQARKHVRDARDFMQGKAPKEIHPTLTETLVFFLPGRAKDLSAPLYFINKFMKITVVEIY